MKSQSGQSTIEFLMVLALTLAFVFAFVRLGIVYTNGYLVHYATFMASRAYMVVDINSNQPFGSDERAFSRAKNVFKKFPLAKFIPGYNMDLSVNHPTNGGGLDNNLYVGVSTNFNQFLMLPAMVGGKKPVKFTSESFLGREPTRAECIERICRAIEIVGGDCQVHATMSDNGC